MNTNYFDCVRKSIIDARGSIFDLQWVPDYPWDINTFKETINHYIINEIVKWYNFEDNTLGFLK